MALKQYTGEGTHTHTQGKSEEAKSACIQMKQQKGWIPCSFVSSFTFKGQPLKSQYDRKSQLTADRVDL